MAKLPNPQEVGRGTPTPGGPGGYAGTELISPAAVPGAEIAGALQQIGSEAHQFAMREKARMDDVAFDDAKNQYLQKSLETEAEYSQIKGKAAVDTDIVADYTTKLDNISEEISSGFKNDTQRQAWDSYYGSAKVQFTAGVMKHKLTESDTYAAETYAATNVTRMQNAHSNWADPDVVNSSASDIVRNVAKERQRLGWSDERTEVELRNALEPLWSGVAAQYINAKQYGMAKKILDQHKEVIGVDNYTSLNKSIAASETIDLSQQHAASIVKNVDGETAQRAAARDIGGTLGDATLERVKTYQTEMRVQEQQDAKAQSVNDTKWVSDFGIEALSTDNLTVQAVEDAGLSDENTALWKDKVFSQGVTRNKEKAAKSTNDVYATWIERATLEPEKWIPDDVAKDLNPNNGGLTGPQYKSVLSELATNQTTTPKTAATAAAVRGKAQLKSMYQRGDFGVVKTESKRGDAESWLTYSDILIDYQRKILEEPTVDHTDWLEGRLEEEGAKALQESLDADFSLFGIGDESDEIISEWLIKNGKATSPKNIKAVRERYSK